ncbi:MAG: ArsR/SmtB family transcription factor [Flavisolibacter sp.]
MHTLQENLEIETLELKKAALRFRAINHSLRQDMLRFLHKRGRVTVTDVYVKLNLEQPVASTHLAILRRANLVTTQREGKFIFYSVNYQQLKHMHQIAEKLIG